MNLWIFMATPGLEFFAYVVSFHGRVYAMDRNGTIAALDGH
jgi:hypothetical protein